MLEKSHLSTIRKLTPNSIVTFTGKIIEPLNPDPADIDIRDIAHSLSQQCRFTGHTKEFYSVAQHSVLVSQECDPKDAAWGLLHDATEAYLSDIARPLKRANGFGDVYKRIETGLMTAIARHFDLPGSEYVIAPIPDSVKAADNILLATEMRDLMPERCSEEMDIQQLVPLQQTIIPWTPRQAHGEFMVRFLELL